MQESNQSDGLDWARKPRSEKAWQFLFALVAEKEPKFIDLMIQHKREGRIVDGKATQRWDYAGQQWVRL